MATLATILAAVCLVFLQERAVAQTKPSRCGIRDCCSAESVSNGCLLQVVSSRCGPNFLDLSSRMNMGNLMGRHRDEYPQATFMWSVDLANEAADLLCTCNDQLIRNYVLSVKGNKKARYTPGRKGFARRKQSVASAAFRQWSVSDPIYEDDADHPNHEIGCAEIQYGQNEYSNLIICIYDVGRLNQSTLLTSETPDDTTFCSKQCMESCKTQTKLTREGGSTRSPSRELATNESLCDWQQYCPSSVDHVMCQYPSLGNSCAAIHRKVEFSQKEEILHFHNSYRNEFASRSLKKHLQVPEASDMRQLFWDDELEQLAHHWASQCKNGLSDECRNVERFAVGQNVGVKNESCYTGDEEKYPYNAWIAAEPMLTEEMVKHYIYEGPHESLRHYVQVIWATTRYLGCAESSYMENGTRKRQFICNYGPAGVRTGYPIYSIGGPCGRCPVGMKCSYSYPNLCKGIRSISGSFELLLLSMVTLLSY